MSLYDDIHNACLGHEDWKAQLERAIATGRFRLSPQQAEADDGCDFGRWLYSLPLETRRTHYWETVRGLHALFHKQAGLVLRLALDGHTELARLAMGPGSGFDRVSNELDDEMRHWRKGHRCGDYPKGAGNAIYPP